MIFLFPRWDILVPWRVLIAGMSTCFCSLRSIATSIKMPQAKVACLFDTKINNMFSACHSITSQLKPDVCLLLTYTELKHSFFTETFEKRHTCVLYAKRMHHLDFFVDFPSSGISLSYNTIVKPFYNLVRLMVQKSGTSWYGKYPIIYRVLYMPGGCLGFLNHQQ